MTYQHLINILDYCMTQLYKSDIETEVSPEDIGWIIERIIEGMKNE